MSLIYDFIWPTPVSGIINLVNLVLLLRAVTLGWSQLKRYKDVELSSISTVRKRVIDWLDQFEKKLNTPGKNEEKDIPNLMIDTHKLVDKINKDSLIAKRIQAINSLKRHRVRVNINALQQTTIAEESSNPGVKLPNNTANIAIMLGLLGTFIGLFEMVRSVSFLMASSGKLTEVSSILSVLKDMEVIFKGIRMAFSTSIVGMFSAIICFYLGASIRKYQQKVLVALDTFTNQELLPVTVPSIEDQHLLEIVANEIRASFHQLDSIFTKNTTMLKELNVIEETFQQIVKDIRNITHREESKNFDSIIGQITQTNYALSQLISHLPEMLGSTKQYGELVAKKVDTTLEKLKITEAKTRSFDAMLGEVAQTNKALSLLVNNLPEMLRAMKLCTQSISEKADVVSKVAAGYYPIEQRRGFWYIIKKLFS